MDKEGLPEKVYDDLAKNPLRTISDYLGAMLYFKLGPKVEAAADYKAIHEARRKVMLENATKIIGNIPPEYLRAADMQILRMAAADADFCVENETLSDMFAQLLASCFDARKSVHPAYSSILKNLSPLDAQNFALLDEVLQPVVKLQVTYEDRPKEEVVFVYDIFLENDAEKDIYANSVSIDNLKRLNLVETNYSNYLPEERYSHIDKNEICRILIGGRDPSNREVNDINLIKGVLAPTSFGIHFFKACTNDHVTSV